MAWGLAVAVTADETQRMLAALPAAATGAVIGAPGSGKTTTIVERVRALIDGGMSPDEVLVLTPTRQTATALRDRLALAVGGATSGPLARSVASFAFQLVRGAAVHAGAEPPQLLTGGDEDQLVLDLLDGDAEDERRGIHRWPAELGAEIRATKGFRAEVRAFLAECTTLGIDPRRLRLLAERHDLPVWASLASFATEYHDVRAGMRGAHRDAAGLLREAVGILRTATDAALGDVAGLRAVLVDDAQELTLGGVELLAACRRRGIAVLAFGDPDVGSGAFRGATPENFARLTSELGGIAGVLAGQHRSTAAQTDLVRAVTQRIGAAGLVAHRCAPTGAEPDASVRALRLRSPSEEYDVIARLLRERHVRDGVPWSACAVIAHDTRQVAALEAELGAREVPARASGPGRALGTLGPVRDLLRLIELASVPAAEWTADDAHAALIGCCGGLDPVSIRRLRTTLRHAELASGGERSGRDLLLSAMAHPIEFELVDTREGRRAARIARTLATLRDQLAEGATVHELLWTAWERSGLEREWGQAARGYGPLAEQADRDLDAVVALFESAKRFVERQGEDARPDARRDGVAMTFVHGILSADVAEDRLGRPALDEGVAILTPAAALGTEFDTVVIAGVQDGVWPNTRLRGSLLETWRLADAAAGTADAAEAVDRRRGALHDELRLFARALSRARARVVVTAVDDDDTGPSVLFELLPTPEDADRRMEHPLSLRGLVALHRRTLTDPGSAAARRERAAGQLALLAGAAVVGADPAQWYGVLPPTSASPLRDTAREDVRVSPSRLHALETCQLDWVIADLGGDAGGAVAGVGTILHAALEHAETADQDALWRVVEGRWSELEFESAWRDRAERTRARELVRRLSVYLGAFTAGGGRLLGAEPHFEVRIDENGGAFQADAGEPAGEPAPGIVLSGYIDRVELTGDGSVVIVDLKTGKNEPQTDRAVAENPQLAAYQLAFESGAIPAAAGHPAGGAKLLVLRPTAGRRDYVEPRQPPFDDTTREAFLSRVRDAAAAMSGSAFLAPYEEHCRDDHSYGLCRIHTIKAVSAS